MTDNSTYDVAIIGAGPAGCGAALFCARTALEPVLITDGRSTLQKCAYIENYLGFPAGVEPGQLQTLMQAHVERTGCRREEGTVEAVDSIDGGFELTVDEQTIRAEYLLAASWSISEYLDGLGVETQQEEDGPVDEIVTDEQGRTNVEGIYAAGRITGTHHQALVCAGDGARVALNVINECIPEFYNDWIAPEGYYERYDREIPRGVEEIDHETRTERATNGREWMRTFFTDDSN